LLGFWKKDARGKFLVQEIGMKEAEIMKRERERKDFVLVLSFEEK